MESLEKQKDESVLLDAECLKAVDSKKEYVLDGSSEYIEQLFK
ncbi:MULTISPECIES: hypothetical protein [Bacillaceae]|uniref:Uncharacterized protein n=1 Tax=Peribacillus huizhouensis TaxID=1501239 RepID=A0ABR6CR39_9BACI|nr:MULTISPECIES: hypothetical protein [Bacillaceae]MBA9027045.1 hypothetical protein [Peribacillus huizhouensis]